MLTSASRRTPRLTTPGGGGASDKPEAAEPCGRRRWSPSSSSAARRGRARSSRTCAASCSTGGTPPSCRLAPDSRDPVNKRSTFCVSFVAHAQAQHRTHAAFPVLQLRKVPGYLGVLVVGVEDNRAGDGVNEVDADRRFEHTLVGGRDKGVRRRCGNLTAKEAQCECTYSQMKPAQRRTGMGHVRPGGSC